MIRRVLGSIVRSAAASLKMADTLPATTVAPSQTREDASDLGGEGGGNRKRLVEEGDVGQSKKLKTEAEAASAATNGSGGERPQRVLKRKVAMLLSYAGANYVGMQRNPGVSTIEEDLVRALVKCGAIPEEHGRNMGKMNFQRCARTDKGVSAAGQVVSLKLLLLDNLVEKINKHLPPVIQVMGVLRTTAGFNSKNNCEFRTYTYLLPSFAFTSLEDISMEKSRVTDEKIAEVNEQLQKYVGTHNFHNFTSGKAFTDPSANRYMKAFYCEKSFVDDGIEFAIIKVQGQSFMLHQIRKMIGLVIAVVRGLAPSSIIERAFGEEKLDIPRAPSLGLVLESVHYDCYNKRWGNDGLHEPLTFEDCKERIEAFKHKHIYPNIIVREKYNKSMFQWLSTLPLHSYDVVGTPNPLRLAHAELKNAKAAAAESAVSSTGGSLIVDDTSGSPELKCPAEADPLREAASRSPDTSARDEDQDPSSHLVPITTLTLASSAGTEELGEAETAGGVGGDAVSDAIRANAVEQEEAGSGPSSTDDR